MNQWFEAAKAAAWGAVCFGGLSPFMDTAALARAEVLCPHPAGVLVAAFPYYAGDGPGNLSRYARGEDYHRVVVARLETVCAHLREQFPGKTFVPVADHSPIPEGAAAQLAGVGLRGKNGLIIVPPYGSYVFLGTILTDLPLETTASAGQDCADCGLCVAACPAGALDGGGVSEDRCLSCLTQKKGALTHEEARRLGQHPLIWGCDTCQEVCPYNQCPAETTIPAFRERLISSLSLTDLEGLTNRQFQEKYGARAFAWRGVGVLRRNLDL